jgi:hypothetical protein
MTVEMALTPSVFQQYIEHILTDSSSGICPVSYTAGIY